MCHCRHPHSNTRMPRPVAASASYPACHSLPQHLALSGDLVRAHNNGGVLIATFTNRLAADFALNWARQLHTLGLRSLIGISERLVGWGEGAGGDAGGGEEAFKLAGAGLFCADGPSMKINGQAGRWAEVAPLLRSGLDVLLSDSDIAWFHNPIPYFRAVKQAHPHVDFLLSTDRAFNGYSAQQLAVQPEGRPSASRGKRSGSHGRRLGGRRLGEGSRVVTAAVPRGGNSSRAGLDGGRGGDRGGEAWGWAQAGEAAGRRRRLVESVGEWLPESCSSAAPSRECDVRLWTGAEQTDTPAPSPSRPQSPRPRTAARRLSAAAADRDGTARGGAARAEASEPRRDPHRESRVFRVSSTRPLFDQTSLRPGPSVRDVRTPVGEQGVQPLAAGQGRRRGGQGRREARRAADPEGCEADEGEVERGRRD